MKIEIFNDSVEKFIQSLEKNTIAKVIHKIPKKEIGIAIKRLNDLE